MNTSHKSKNMTRTKPMPPRRAVGWRELLSLFRCYWHYRKIGLDPGYDGTFEDRFCKAFAEMQGGGYADAVSSGTASLYVALKSLKLPAGSLIATSPVTDASVIGVICEQGHRPYLIDSAPDSYNVTLEQLEDRFRPDIKAMILTHAAGEPSDPVRIASFCAQHGVELIEDCSQAVGAIPKASQMKVGNFGRLGCFSTMYRKNLSVSGSSGIVFTRDESTHRIAKQHADRGKKWWNKELVDMRDPGFADFPGLNWNSDEFRCAIGLANLSRLERTNSRRRAFLNLLVSSMRENPNHVLYPYNYHEGFSPFYFPILVDPKRIKISVDDFARALQAEGIGIGVRYGCLVSTWNWAKPVMFDGFESVNALSTRDRCFHLYVNENYGKKELDDVLKAFHKISTTYQR